VPKVDCSPSGEADIRSLNGESPLAQALAGAKPQRVGWFRLYFDDERWEWSPEVEQIHGYEPGTVQPTTALVLSHKHPEDYEQVAATLDEIRRTHEPFSTRHRIIDVQGRTREVVVVAGHLRNDAGEVIGTDGFYVDLTRSVEEHQTMITEAVAEIAEHRSTIEQAKGVLMMVYDIDADAAFDVLRWRSQESNIKL
jgi:PAS domain S-box-containing protein